MTHTILHPPAIGTLVYGLNNEVFFSLKRSELYLWNGSLVTMALRSLGHLQ